MRYRVEFADGLMMVMDDDGNGHDAHVLQTAAREEAERKIDQWANEYRINVARAKRELRDIIGQM